MEFIIITAVAAVGSSGAAYVAALLKTRKLTHHVRLQPQSKVENFLEQKELCQWLVMEVAEYNNITPSKETIADLLGKLATLYQSAKLAGVSKGMINDAIQAAYTALHVIPSINRPYMFLLGKLVEGTVAAVLRASGEKENVHQFMKTIPSIRGITSGFQSFSGGTIEIEQWKNQAGKGRPNQ